VGEDRQANAQTHKRWWHHMVVAIAVCALLLAIFNRPILLALGRQIALHYAAKENLKAAFRLEGNVFTNLTVRNLHAFPSGPSPVESIDADLVRVDYSIPDLIFHGLSDFLKNIEINSASIVLDPRKASPPKPPKPNEKTTLPAIFPERLHLIDATVIVRNRPHDFVMEHVDLDLNPRNPGQLEIDKLELVGGQVWLKVAAQTSYANRVLILREMALSNDERVRELRVDASRIGERKLAINLDYSVGAGKLSGSFALTEAQSSFNTDLHLHAENVPLGVINKYAAFPEGFIRGQIEKLDADLSGLISSPRTWQGKLILQISNFQRQGIAFDRATFQISAGNGTALLQTGEVTQGENQFHINGSGELPLEIKEFGHSPATLEIALTAPDLQKATAGIPHRLSGAAQLNGRIDIKTGKVNGEFAFAATSLGFEDGAAETLNATIKLSKTVPPINVTKPWFTDLRVRSNLKLSNAHYRDYLIDSVEGTIDVFEDVVSLELLNLRRNQNEIVVRGQYRLPEEIGKAVSQPAALDFSLNAPEASRFWTSDSPDKLTGPLQIAGQITWKQQIANGQLSIFGSNLKMRDLVFKQLSSQSSISNNVIYLNDLTASLNERDFVNGHGSLDLHAPYHYSGIASVSISNLSTLQPLLRALGNRNEVSGSIAFDWEGSGNAQTFKNSGKLKLVLEKGRYGDLQSVRANIDATYSPDGLDVPIIFFASNNMDFQAIAQAKGETLEISKIQLDQGAAKFAAGYASIPFVWRNLGTSASVCPPNGKVVANFQSENLDIKKLFADVGAKPVTSGILNIKLDAQGTIADLNARLDVQMRDLRSERFPKLEPATFDLNAQAIHDQLTVSGKLQQARIQPLELSANLPFDIPKIARTRKLPDETPITAKARLPRSSVNFIRQFVPEVQQLDGDLGLDVDVRGTIARPVLSGSADMTINVARPSNVTLPALNNFKARLNFTGDALTIQQFGGELSGGKFAVTGGVRFPKLTQPTVDLQLKADSALIARNDTLTARANADIKVTGPFASANVTGAISMTNSHFLKNIDLIPIGLPGRPAPEPPSARPEFSFPELPLRDWKFDVAIRTKDPVGIRGNLATGGATADLKLTGTGLRPELQGTVRLENVEATLPFSRLQVSHGFLYFDPSDSMNPRIDLQGTSVIRDYTVRVYVYGTLDAPETIFTSEPPLAQEEIISLIATGVTRAELSGNSNVLAGRAGMLLVQQLYRKIFKKGEATQSNTVFNRLDLDVGTVDPRTGRQQVSGRFKINDQFVFVGDIGVGGDYRGMLKYLIRFR
jgi:translocation-and-assembly-module (TAM) inner membrane subunit TamB-like protein